VPIERPIPGVSALYNARQASLKEKKNILVYSYLSAVKKFLGNKVDADLFKKCLKGGGFPEFT
jgi:hypothetical protein